MLIVITICSQYNKQHIIPLEEVKLESLADEGRKYIITLLNTFMCIRFLFFALLCRVL